MSLPCNARRVWKVTCDYFDARVEKVMHKIFIEISCVANWVITRLPFSVD